MGGGIGQWLLYRAGDESLSLFALVVPPARRRPSTTISPGASSVCTAASRTRRSTRASGDELTLVERRALEPGDLYALFPPHDDIHRVTTTSADTSVSIHLLTNDTGCTWRHTYDPETGAQEPFRSGYANVACPPEA